MADQKQLIIIKGTRDGLNLFIDDSCGFDEALEELNEKLVALNPKIGEPAVSVTVQLGNRYLDDKKKELLRYSLEEKNRFFIHSFESNVILREDAIKWWEANEIKAVNRLIRSGQVLEVTGDLLLIGDVNPGGRVVASGNIFVLGNLHGVAHAGAQGDQRAVIMAAHMKPTQLRIAEYISRAPDYESAGVYMECGYIDEEEDKIMIDRLQVLTYKRKDLCGFERRMLNG